MTIKPELPRRDYIEDGGKPPLPNRHVVGIMGINMGEIENVPEIPSRLHQRQDVPVSHKGKTAGKPVIPPKPKMRI